MEQIKELENNSHANDAVGKPSFYINQNYMYLGACLRKKTVGADKDKSEASLEFHRKIREVYLPMVRIRDAFRVDIGAIFSREENPLSQKCCMYGRHHVKDVALGVSRNVRRNMRQSLMLYCYKSDGSSFIYNTKGVPCVL